MAFIVAYRTLERLDGDSPLFRPGHLAPYVPGSYYHLMAKYHFSYQDIHKTAKDIAERVKASGFQPDIIVAIGSGGFIPARILRTFLNKPILAVGVAYYDADNRPSDLPCTVQWIEEAERKLSGKRILLVDEVDDSRTTLEYCVRELLAHAPTEVAVAVLHDKKKEKRGALPPEVRHYWAGLTLEDAWIVYPWDALDIDAHDALRGGEPGGLSDE